MKGNAQPKTIRLEDYRAPDYLIETTELRFELEADATTVHATLAMRANPAVNSEASAPLVLNGADLTLLNIALDGRSLSEGEYSVAEETLCIPSVDSCVFTLEVMTRISPEHNTSLEGLYASNGMYCTQCEAEGFRKMTYYLDRPDVMSVFTTTIVADRKRFPVLLSNGNLVDQGDMPGGQHWVKWEDPFKKPAYLFALVAGKLKKVEDEYLTCSGRRVSLQIFVEPHDLDKCEHAMQSLKNAMRWDETVYGREYDLSIYMIVAVSHFNMGAMENKGLNIFNSSCVLANPETTTDQAFQRVEGVIAHEYFHNWSGNRVTCRDWFQLSLKEGFTVFRDAEFSADMGSRVVKRIEDVKLLRSAQFAEDASPMAHPVRPSSYIEINNFYTLTVYEKGAEIVRMIYTLVGAEGFRRGSDLYFERHDGQAVTTDDFVKAMEDANAIDLSQFKRWYDQAGTPTLSVSDHYDETTQQYHLTIKQNTPATPGQETKSPFLIPVLTGLLDSQGQDMAVNLISDQSGKKQTSTLLQVIDTEQTYTFENVPEQPVPSLLRGFSAPVKLHYAYSDEQLAFLMAHDSDDFNRWNASQALAMKVIMQLIEDCQQQRLLELSAPMLDAYGMLLGQAGLDEAVVAEMMQVPEPAYIMEAVASVDVEAIQIVRKTVKSTIAETFYDDFLAVYERLNTAEPYTVDASAIARRSLKNRCLGFLMATQTREATNLCLEQLKNSSNMTDEATALRLLAHSSSAEKQAALSDFYDKWQHEPLVVDQWFAVQATAPVDGVIEHVATLLGHPAFELTNPNKVRALIGQFAANNFANFHRADGEGYRFLTDRVIALNQINPQVAARLVTHLARWRKFDAPRQKLMCASLENILATDNLSPDVYEIASKSLEG